MSAVTGRTAVDPAGPVAAGAEPAAAVELSGVTHWFFVADEARVALADVSLSVASGEFVAVVGASGCGKTTVLNMIAGLVSPERGAVTVRSNGTRLTPPSSSIGYMWARDALLPWRSLVRNVEFGLELRGVGRSERRARALEVIGAVGLAGNERRYPRQLSQGMRQRANLARLLAIEPQLFLMDEPFSALDAQTKHALQREFAKIHDRSPRSVVYVTHDLAEAALLADRIVVMSRGRIARDITVPFSRPRDLDDLRFDEDFGAFTRELWTLLSDLEGRPL